MGSKIQLMEVYVDIDLGHSLFIKLDKGIQIPYSLIKGMSTGRPIPSAFRLYGASFGGARDGLFRTMSGNHLCCFENEFDTLHFDLNNLQVGKFKITRLIVGVENPEFISEAISERLAK